MPVDYPTSLLTQRLQLVANDIDAGASNGFLRLLDGAGAILSSFQLSRPCGVASGGALTFSGLSLIDPAAAGSGTAATGRIEDSNGTVIVSGLLVGGATPDIALSTPVIVAGQTVALTAATIIGN